MYYGEDGTRLDPLPDNATTDSRISTIHIMTAAIGGRIQW
jgi:hypothetical protein